MNKTLSIALAGFSFIIEEQAYIKLSDYLSALRNSLEADEVDEVMHDIEIRIVEILKDSLGKREVVYDADVEQIINQIGRPEVIEEQEEAYYSGSKKAKQNHRQLFRDPERKKISGVCSGLAQYVGMDIAVMRSIWLGIAVLGLFSAAIPTTFIVIIYTFLTITIPKAKTASDFLKMKGKPLNFDNIKDESNKIVQFANESGKKVSSFYNENKANINSTASKIGDIIRYILGGIFSLMAIGGIISIVGAFIFSSDSINISDGAELFLPFQGDIFVILGLAFFTLLLPTIIFIFLAIKMFSPKTKLKNWGYITGGILLLWIILVSVIGGMIVKEATQYQGENTTEENVSIPATSDTLYVNSYKVAIPSHFKAYGKKFWSDKKEIFHKERLYVDVTKKNIDAPYLIIKKEANGYNIPLKVVVPVQVNGNQIALPNYIKYPFAERFRGYDVDYELVVPTRMKVINQDDTISLYEDEDDNQSTHHGSMNLNHNDLSINIDSDKDSATVNGKKVSKQEAQKLMDSITADFNFDDLKPHTEKQEF